MRRVTINYLVDAVALLNLILLMATGVILKWILPPGSGGGYGRGYRGGRGPEDVKQLLDLGRHDWGDIHFILSLLFIFLMLVHLILHWSWIKTSTRALFSPSPTARQDPTDEEPLP